jgi:zinc protease
MTSRRTPSRARIGAAVLTFVAAPALAAPGVPETRALPNGLKLVLLQDHTLPLVAASLWVHAGSKDEIESSAGYAHFLEHLVQRGTDTSGPFEYQRLAQRWGGALSVRSNYDRTSLTVTGVPSALPDLIGALAAMAFRATLLDKEIDLELGALTQEIRTYYDQPASVAFLETMRAAFPEHPYRHPMLGSFRTLGTLRQAPLGAFYRNLYVPNNMALALAGDFEAERAAALVASSFGRAARSATLTPKPEAPAKFPGHKDVEKPLPIKETWVNLSFTGPGYRHPDRAAFEIVARALGEAGGSPVTAALVRDKVGTSARVSYYLLEDAGMLYVGLTPSTPELSYTAARSALQAVVDLKKRGLDPTALQVLVERQLLEARLRAEILSERAEGLAEAALFGGTRYYWDLPLVYARLSADDVRRVAATYLVPDNLRLVIIVPREAGAGATEQKEAFHATLDLLGTNPSPITAAPVGTLYAPEEAGRVTSDAWGNWRDARAPRDPETATLPNGVVVAVLEDRRQPLVALSLHLRAGSGDDPAGREGLAFLAGQLMAAAVRSARRPPDARAGAEISVLPEVQVSRDLTELRLLVPPPRLEAALRALAEAVRRPGFAAPALEAARSAADERLNREQASDPSFVAHSLFAEKAFAGHPYAHPPSGTPTGLRGVTLEELETFHRERLVRSGVVLGIAGDVAAADAIRMARSILGEWPAREVGGRGAAESSDGAGAAPATGGPGPAAPAEGAPRPQAGEFARTIAAPESRVIVGVPGVAIDHPDFEDLRLMGTAFTMMAFEDMVFRRRAAFSVTARPDAWRAGGSLAFEAIAPHLRREEAVFDLQRLMRRLALESLPAGEIEDALRIQAGRAAATAQGVLARASLLSYREAVGLQASSYRREMLPGPAPAPARLREVAARYLRPEAWIVVKAGPPSR